MNDTYKVYVLTDDSGNITAVNSSAFLSDTDGWTEIDEGAGDKYHHAQGNYFEKPIFTAQGVYRYKIADSEVTKKTDGEIEAEVSAQPASPPTPEERIFELETANTALSQTVDLLTVAILEG
jgi:hypothetical protein